MAHEPITDFNRLLNSGEQKNLVKKISNPVGRPSTYSKELAEKICEELAQGKSMRTVCKGDDMPAMSTVFKWLREIKEFSEQYARAKEESTDAMSEDVLFISDESLLEAVNADPKAANAVVQAMRLRVDTRKWIMSKMKPKKYADKVDVTSGGDKIIQGNAITFLNFKNEATS